MDNKNALRSFDNSKILEIINGLPNLTDEDRHELSLKVASDDLAVRKMALENLAKSQLAIHDFNEIMGELSAMNKQGAYIKSKQTIETGSGKFEIEMRGGDRKLIIPVLVILGVIIIAILTILNL